MENKISIPNNFGVFERSWDCFSGDGAGIWKHRTILEALGVFPDNISGKGIAGVSSSLACLLLIIAATQTF